MKITFLGTGTSQGVPVIACDCEVCQSVDIRDNRTRCSIMIEVDSSTFVIDVGPDFRAQMLRERVKKIDAIILTHEHKDHTGGLDDVRPFNFKYNIDMPVYARRQVCEQLKKEYDYIFEASPYPGAPRVLLNEIKNEAFTVNETMFLPIEGLHRKLKVFGYRLKDFTYITDMNKISDKEFAKISGTKTLVINALQKEPHSSHFRLDEALAIIKKVKPARAFLTHLSHRMGLHAKVEQELPQNIKIAFDGLSIKI